MAFSVWADADNDEGNTGVAKPQGPHAWDQEGIAS